MKKSKGNHDPLLTFLGAIVLLILTSPRLALIISAVVPLIIVLVCLFACKTHPMFLLMQQRLDRLNTVLQENLAGIRVVKAFERTANEIARFDEANKALMGGTIQVPQLMALFIPFLLLILNLAIVSAVWIGVEWQFQAPCPLGMWRQPSTISPSLFFRSLC